MFTLQTRLDYYDKSDLAKIVLRSCDLLDCEIDKEGAEEIAARARGTPRIANNLIHFTRDYAEERGDGKINKEIAASALELLEIDGKKGLDEMDKEFFQSWRQTTRRTVGLGTIAVGVNEEEHTLEEVHEPFLIQEGYLKRTPQGRMFDCEGMGSHRFGFKWKLKR